MHFIQKSLLAALVTGSLMATPALAQTAPQQNPPTTPQGMQQQAAPTVDVSESEIEAFAEAYTSVQGLNQEYTAKLQTADNEAAATELQQEAQEKMREAISDAGLSLEEYREIATAANQDMDLQQRLSAAIEEIMSES